VVNVTYKTYVGIENINIVWKITARKGAVLEV
jgi:hypothetical protein